jgi:hypothetical protein
VLWLVRLRHKDVYLAGANLLAKHLHGKPGTLEDGPIGEFSIAGTRLLACVRLPGTRHQRLQEGEAI